MLSFLRRLTKSRVGVIVTFVALIVIALAFAAGGVSRLGDFGGSSGMTPTTVAEVGKAKVTAADLKQRVQSDVQIFKQQQPTLDLQQFVTQGGFDGSLDRIINGIALDDFAAANGMVISRRLVDGQLASIPSLQGPNGQFDPAIYKQILAERQLTDEAVHHDIRQSIVAQQLTDPTAGATQLPNQIAFAYASLLLEKRTGTVAFVPTRAMPAGAAPTDAELAAFYKAHIGAYTVPERRVIRYALVTPDTVKAQATPSEAEIAAAYRSQAAQYQPTEKRALKQVILPDQKAADALAAKVRGGTSIEDAAKSAGLEATTIAATTKSDYTAQTNADAANQAFAAKSGQLVGPVQLPLGWAVIRVDQIVQVPGKTLAQAHDQIAQQLAAGKANTALGDLHDRLDDALSGGAAFSQIVGDNHLTAQATPPVTTAGVDPDHPAVQPDPKLAQVIAAGFDQQQGDSPDMVPVGQDGSFAVVALENVVPAAPRPLAQVHDRVASDFRQDRAAQKAHDVAQQVLAQVRKGTALAAAMKATGLPLPSPQTTTATRAQLAANRNGAPPPLALLFSLPDQSAKLLQAPNGAGWLIVHVDHIVAGNAAGNDALVKATRADLSRLVGQEYVEEFTTAVRGTVGVKKNAHAIADVRAQLLGAAPDATQP